MRTITPHAFVVVAGFIVGCAGQDPSTTKEKGIDDGLEQTSSALSAKPACRPALGGELQAFPVDCPAGTVGDGYCEQGNMIGTITGTALFSETVVVDGDFYRGTEVVRSKLGDLYADERGTLDAETGNIVFLWNIHGGTRKYAGATGQLMWSGNLASGELAYHGQLCTR